MPSGALLQRLMTRVSWVNSAISVSAAIDAKTPTAATPVVRLCSHAYKYTARRKRLVNR